MPIAIQMTQYGPPAVLTLVEREPPAPGPTELVVRTLVAGVNRADCFIRAGAWPQGGGWPYVPGLECCGVVERTGRAVTRFHPGDRVITMMQGLGGIHGTRAGGYQELVTCDEAVATRVPDGMDADMLGVLGLPAVTAMAALDVLSVAPGMRVLVHAGSSAVGQLAIQVARAAGAEVVATGTRAEKAEHVRACGAAFVSTREPAWWDAAGPVDRVFDLVGGDLFARSVGLLRPGGRLVFVGGTAGAEVSLLAWDLMRPVALTGYSSETLTRDALEGFVTRLAALTASGRLASRLVTRFELARAAEAHAALESGALSGRVVLVP